jgi:glycosyltransferase involved in cell wall biosynthesis
MSTPDMIPVTLLFDIEPDSRALRGRKPEPRMGFEKLVELVPALRDRLESASGWPAAFTWCPRIDPQIAEIYGSATWLVARYERELNAFRASGDEFGVHPHSWRWEGRWVSDEADPEWVAHCVAVGLDGYREAFGQPCPVHKHGDNFISTALARQLEDAGVFVDLSIDPGLPAARGLMPNEETTGWLPDTRTVPSHVYRPSRDDFRVPDPSRSDGLILMPLTPGLSLSMHRVDERSVPTGTYEPLSLWLEPLLFREMLGLRLASPTLTHLAFAVRSDTALNPDLWSAVESNQAEVARQLRGRHRWCTASCATDLAFARLRMLEGLTEERTEQPEVLARLWLRGKADPGFRERVDLDALDLEDGHPLLSRPAPRLWPRVSTILPVHRGGRYLRGAVDSVIHQTEPPDELVVVNDGSAHSDLEFLHGVSAPFSIRVVHQPNAGQAAARNRGVREATGELLAFLDQDDLWHPQHLAALCRPFRENPTVAWSYSDFDEIDTDGQFVTRAYLREHGIQHPKRTLGSCVEHDLMVLPSTSVVRRATFEALGGFDETLQGYEDDDMYIRAFRSGSQFLFDQSALTLYRVHKGGASASRRFAESRLRFSRKLQESIPDDRRTGRYYFSDLVVPRFFAASLDDYVRAVSAGEWNEAKQALSDLMHFGRLRRDRVGVRWKLALVQEPRLFRHILRVHDRLPAGLRLTKNPAVRLR